MVELLRAGLVSLAVLEVAKVGIVFAGPSVGFRDGDTRKAAIFDAS